ncbi:MAG TPA: hypothetical protein DCS49_00160 [Gammaproteobacteria bacterium]|nr:hypothetical protein [Gammaproteobacteria bacterium]
MRILILIAIALLLVILFKPLLRRNKDKPTMEDTKQAEKMVKCQYCGVHILEKEAIRARGYYYCSAEHMDADKL